nr:MAG TPA: hypothetical protein [Caudoviricetes sp.]
MVEDSLLGLFSDPSKDRGCYDVYTAIRVNVIYPYPL